MIYFLRCMIVGFVLIRSKSIVESLCVFHIISEGKNLNFELSRISVFSIEEVAFNLNGDSYTMYISLCRSIGDLPSEYVRIENERRSRFDVRAIIVSANGSAIAAFSKKSEVTFARSRLLESSLSLKYESETKCPGSWTRRRRRRRPTNCSLIINFIYDHETAAPRFGIFNEEECSFVVNWKTQYAVPVAMETSSTCAFTHGNQVLSLESLRHPYQHSAKTLDKNLTVIVNFCQAVKGENCLNRNSDFINMCLNSDGLENPLPLSMNKTSCVFDESRNSLKCLIQKNSLKDFGLKSLEFNLICNPNKFVVELFMSKRKKTLKVTIETHAVCVKDASCFVLRGSSKLELPKYENYKFQWENSTFLLSTCGRLTSTDYWVEGESSAAIIGDDNSVKNLGSRRFLSIGEKDSVLLKFRGGSRCRNDESKRFQADLNLVCSERESGPFVEKVDECKFKFVWNHPKVCPVPFSMSKGCAIRNPIEGESYNLSNGDGSHNQFVIYHGDLTFSLDLCTRKGLSCNFSENVSLCLKNGNVEMVLGRRSTQLLTFDQRFLTFEMFGDECRPYVRSRVLIKVVCDYEVSGDSEPFIVNVNFTTCDFQFVWRTSKACPTNIRPNCVVKNSAGSEVNLSVLRKVSSNYRIDFNETAHFILNVCGNLWYGENEMCYTRAGVCLVENESRFSNLGIVSPSETLPTINEEEEIVIVYLTPFLCESSAFLFKGTRIVFQCHDRESEPKYLGYENCTHQFLWKTKHACFPPINKIIINSESFEESASLQIKTTPTIRQILPVNEKRESGKLNLMAESNGKVLFRELFSELRNRNLNLEEKKTVEREKQDELRAAGNFLHLTQRDLAINKTALLYFEMLDSDGSIDGGIYLSSLSHLILKSNGKIINLGSRHSAPKRIRESIRFEYVNGSVCDRDKKINYSSSFNFKCGPNKGGQEDHPMAVSVESNSTSRCHLNFLWETKMACDKDIVIFHKNNCSIANEKTEEIIDVSSVFARAVQVKTESGQYLIQPCSNDLNKVLCDDNDAACLKKEGNVVTAGSVSDFGLYSNITNSTSILVNYGFSCRGNVKYSANIVLKCAWKENVPTGNWTISRNNCHDTLHLESPIFCFRKSETTYSFIGGIYSVFAIFLSLLIVGGLYLTMLNVSNRRTCWPRRSSESESYPLAYCKIKRVKSH